MDLQFRLGEATGSSIAVNILDCAIEAYQSVYQAALAETDKLIRPNIPQADLNTKTTLLKRTRNIPALDADIQKQCRFRIDNLTKPIYSLGRLEEIAEHISGIVKKSETYICTQKKSLF